MSENLAIINLYVQFAFHFAYNSVNLQQSITGKRLAITGWHFTRIHLFSEIKTIMGDTISVPPHVPGLS